MEGVDCQSWLLTQPNHLANTIVDGVEKLLLIDSRSFLEYNTHHIINSVNVCCSKLVKRRLQADKVSVKDLLTQTCHIDADERFDVIVYDQCTENPDLLTEDNFLFVLLRKLIQTFHSVTLLEGGFLAFQAMYPTLCESNSSNYKHAPLTSLSQPCMPVSNVGPTRILPFLYLGSQRDAMSEETVQVNSISYILNVSTTCTKPTFIQDGHFLRIPVNDNYSEKLTPHFTEAFQFLDKVRESNGCVLVHCLAGISRSPTIAIAYIMKHFHMSSDEAYRYVKDKRPTISPNFNFLGQLLDFEKDVHHSWGKYVRSGFMTADSCGKFDFKTSPAMMDLCSPSSPAAKSNKTFFTEKYNRTSEKLVLTCSKNTSTTTSTVVVKESVQYNSSINGTRIGVPSSKSTPNLSCIQKAHTLPVAHRPNIINGIHSVHLKAASPRLRKFTGLTPAVAESSQTAQSPTTALARLSFTSHNSENSPTSSPLLSSVLPVCQKQTEIPPLSTFPTTSLDQLNFMPCSAKDNQSTGSSVTLRQKITVIGTKRPISCTVGPDSVLSTDILSSPSDDSNGSASPSNTSPTSAQNSVILRRSRDSGDSRAKRPSLVRPNSIAFSSYPTFDFGTDCSKSATHGSRAVSQDDSSHHTNTLHKRSKHSNNNALLTHTAQYSEKTLYKQITAAMESAMIKTQVREASRKSRSLDDILNSDDITEMDSSGDISLHKSSGLHGLRPCTDLFSPITLFDSLQKRCRGSSDPYQSNSSISSGGSHGSVHGSLEVIQVS